MLVFKNVESKITSNEQFQWTLMAEYNKLKFSDEDFTYIVGRLRAAIVASKKVKLPKLKKIIYNFSQFRSIIVFTPSSHGGTVFSKTIESDQQSTNFHGYKPTLFDKLSGIEGLNTLFTKFFEKALKDETL